jgi:Flagellar motor switch protein
MSTPNQNPVNAESTVPEQNAAQEKAKNVELCNFRLAGRLSNEDARTLTAMHESIAQQIGEVLDLSMGIECHVRFRSLREISAREFSSDGSAPSYSVPFESGMVTVEFGTDLVFPLIELLMGGTGDPSDTSRDLSEIEEELMQDIVAQVMRPVESTWSIPGISLTPGARVKPPAKFQALRPGEKVTILRFEASVGNAVGSFHLALAKPFLDLLMKRIKSEQPQANAKVRTFPAPPLRERMLDCDMEVVTELVDLKVAVRDLVRLRRGSVLKLRAPIRTPGMLTAGGRALFEATPVRSGRQRAAQLGRRVPTAEWRGIEGL